MSKLKIAIDYDGTIADTNIVKVQWIKEEHGTDVPSWRCDHTTIVSSGILSETQYKVLANDIYGENLSSKAPRVDGVGVALDVLSQIGDLYIVTARTDEWSRWALQWLKREGLDEFFKDVFTTESPEKRSKEEICVEHGFDILIDDDERWLRTFNNDGISLILLKSGIGEAEKKKLEDDLPSRIRVAGSWAEATEIIKEIAEELSS